MRRSFLAAALLAVAVAVSATPLTQKELEAVPNKKLPNDEIEAKLPDSHPMFYFLYSAKLFRAGKRDEATLWYYVGEIRFRQHLLAHPEMPEKGDPALFEQAKKAFGPGISDWAGGNIRVWLQQIRNALDWDEKHPNNFTSKDTYAAQLKQARDEVNATYDKIKETQGEIKADRAARGLLDRDR